MKFRLIVFLLMLSTVGMNSYAENIQSIKQEKAHVETSGLPRPVLKALSALNTTTSSIAVIKNELAVLYTNNNKLRFRTNKYKTIIDEGSAYKPQKFWLVVKGKYVYAFWWVKFVFTMKDGKKQILRGKTLYVRASDDYGKTFSPKVRVNSGEGVLPTIEIVADTSGHVSIIYSDERYPRYQVYLNTSLDGGKTWLKEDIRLDKVLGQGVKQMPSYAGTPHLLSMNDKLIAIWQQLDKHNGSTLTRVIARESKDHGITWEDEEIVFQSKGDVASTLDVLATDDELYVFWLDKKKKGLILFSRKDNENKWFAQKNIAPGTSTSFAISWLKGVVDDNFLYLAFTYEKNPIKDYVASIKYDRKKKEWFPDVHRLDRHAPNLKYIAKSMNADILMLPNKSIMTVWEDYEDVLPGIHADIFSTKSQKWLTDKIRLTESGRVDARTPKLYLGENKVFVVFYLDHLIDGLPPYTALAYLSYPLDENRGAVIQGQKKTIPDSLASNKILREKVTAIWNARLENNRAKEWPFYDPVYRSKFNREKWLKASSGLSYASFTITDVNVEGVFARIKGVVTYKLPQEKMINTMLDPEDKKQVKVNPAKPIKSTFNMKFGWFNNDWYFIPELMFMNHLDE